MKTMSNVKLTLENWGPIESGEIEIKPLTVFVGPNNTGKSYTSMLYYAFARSIDRALNKILFTILFRELDKLHEKARSLYERISPHVKQETVIQILENIIELFLTEFNYALRDLLRTLLCEEIERVYASKLRHLIRAGAERARVSLTLHADILRLTCTLYVDLSGNTKLDLELNVVDKRKLIENMLSLTNVNLQLLKLMPFSPVALFIEILKSLSESLRLAIERVHYIPASRAGILYSYRSLAKAIISLIPLIVIRGIELPGIPGTIADFLANLVGLTPEKERSSDVVESIEKEIMEGKIMLVQGSREEPPTIVYEPERGSSISLTGVSSMIAELAPLDLYIKYGSVNEGDTLIIEEPEAHLHPDKQAKLTEILVKLVNRMNLSLIITTHSDIILAKLSNLISMSTLPEDELKDLGYTPDVTITPDKVAVYHFKREGDGVVIERVKVTEEGIPDDVFRKIIEDLYEETMTIYYRLQKYRKIRE